MTSDPLQLCLAIIRFFSSSKTRPDTLAIEQAQKAKQTVLRLTTKPLKPNQLAALMSLVADVEGGYVAAPSVSFEKSFLLVALNKGMFQIAAAEFHTFCYSNGKLSVKAWNKRRAEHYLFVTGRLLF